MLAKTLKSWRRCRRNVSPRCSRQGSSERGQLQVRVPHVSITQGGSNGLFLKVQHLDLRRRLIIRQPVRQLQKAWLSWLPSTTNLAS